MSQDANRPDTGPAARFSARARAWLKHSFERETPEKAAARRERHDPRVARQMVVGLSAFLLLVVGFLVVFDWNWLRGPAGAIASTQLRRTVVLAGDLDVHPWSLNPRAEIHDLRIAQPSWAFDAGAKPGEQMARVGRLEGSLQLADLLRGHTVLGYVRVHEAKVHLIRDRDGRGNWEFGARNKGRSARLPAVRRLLIDRAELRLDDAQRKAVFEGVVSTEESTTGEGAGRFLLKGDGSLNRARFTARVEGEPLLNISPNRPYHFNADVRAGATRIRADGQIDRPFDLNRFGARFQLSGADMNDLYVLTGIVLPNTPPYRISAGLVRDGGRWHLNRARGMVGESDIAGRLTVDTSGEKPYLTADLRSRRVDFDDLGAFFGMRTRQVGGETKSTPVVGGRLLPDSTLQVDRIRAMNADVKFRADAVNAPGLPLRRFSLDLDLDDGVLKMNPISFSLDRGTIKGTVVLNATKAVPHTDLDLRMTGGRIEDWVSTKVQGLPVVEGALAARLKLSGSGNSVHRAASNANGSFTLVAPRGEVRQAFAELLGVNASAGLIKLLSEDPQKTPLRCAVADFQVKDGVARSNRILVDTGVVLAEGSGTINLEKETMNLRFEGDSKKPRLLRLFLPITIKGPLTKPGVGVEAGPAVAQGGLAAALATLSPFAAILPFVDPGLANDANCGALVREGRKRGAPTSLATAPVTESQIEGAEKEAKDRRKAEKDERRDREKAAREARRDRD
ncbi:MAG: AsmA family protein [Caulobacter sp.]|nr:AsmA family protein [Caulobacter sp.]